MCSLFQSERDQQLTLYLLQRENEQLKIKYQVLKQENDALKQEKKELKQDNEALKSINSICVQHTNQKQQEIDFLSSIIGFNPIQSIYTQNQYEHEHAQKKQKLNDGTVRNLFQ